jgi:hypothetical protein
VWRRGPAPTAHGGQLQPLIAVGREYVRWAVEDPAVARVAFAAGRTEPATRISPHPHDVLAAELDRLADAGGLPAEPPPFPAWPMPRSAHSEALARHQAERDPASH